ncbi:MAG: YeeE/YedE thiosulfate transporter family protein [Alphaproteobacteria bacterium]
MDAFTPLQGAIGGAMIGLSAAFLLLVFGRIAGISGILGGLLPPRAGETGWRAAFVAGLIAGPLAVAAATGTLPAVELQSPVWALVPAGLIVGFGTRLGSGCTSGHGVCGLVRLSRRSIAATATFFAVALATVYVIRHLAGGQG